MLLTPFPRKTSFLQRSASIASLVAWKERFEANVSGKTKKVTFVSYMNDSVKLTRELEDITPVVQYDPADDLPPSYNHVVTDPPLPPPPTVEKTYGQDFTALENYLKKNLLTKKKPKVESHDSASSAMEYETEQVFRWLHELPEGDNLEEFLEAYGIPTDSVDMEGLKERLRHFVQEKLAASSVQNQSNNSEEEERNTANSTTKWQRQMTSLEELAYEDNLEKWLESLDVPYFRPIPQTKEEIRKYLNIKLELIPEIPIPSPPDINKQNQPNEVDFTPKWKELVERMKDLKNEDELEKWLDNLEVPCSIPRDKVKAELKKFFMHETFDGFQGKSMLLQEHSLAKELWEKFENSGHLKQVAMIAGTTAALALVAVLASTMLSFAFPAALAMNPYFTEVFAQYFLQRQEVAFNLLNFHAQNAKPLSTAWAKQYVLWKYC